MMKDMTSQQMFDKAMNHMRAQGNRWGTYFERGWTYVNPNNPCERCAVGILMEVELDSHSNQYKLTQESREELFSITSLALDGCSLRAALSYIFEHDKPINWETRFEKTAKRFNLQYTEPTKTKESSEKIESCNTLS